MAASSDRASRKPAAPREVRIGPIVYKIYYDDGAEWTQAQLRAAKQDAGEGDPHHILYGYTMNSQQWISINPDLPEPQRRLTLTHELFHAMHTVIGDPLDVMIDKEEGADIEEYMAAVMAAPMLSMLRDNPELVAYLTGE